MSMQITKSVNLDKDGGKASDTMGMKHRIDRGIYVTYGSINCQLAEKTGFSSEDADKLKEALRTLFRDDASSARPEGSMAVLKLIWWKHDSKIGQYSSAKVHDSLRNLLKEAEDGTFDEAALQNALGGLVPEIIEGE
jgi:CRISPR-associated protein Csd2